MADPADKYQVGAPSNGDLWVMYVHPGGHRRGGRRTVQRVHHEAGKRPFWLLWPASSSGVLKTADYKETRKMETVREGELIVELGPVPRICTNEACSRPLPMNDIEFCPYCGEPAQPDLKGHQPIRRESLGGNPHDENSFRNQKPTRRGSGGRSSQALGPDRRGHRADRRGRRAAGGWQKLQHGTDQPG